MNAKLKLLKERKDALQRKADILKIQIQREEERIDLKKGRVRKGQIK